jgi:hypothetical protein
VSALACRRMVSNLTTLIVVHILVGQFSPCLKQGFIFFTLVIPGSKKSKKQMNIFLRLLMEELKELRQGVDAYDSHLKY